VPTGFWLFTVGHRRESSVFSYAIKHSDFGWMVIKKRPVVDCWIILSFVGGIAAAIFISKKPSFI
jgi:hypothetical protein